MRTTLDIENILFSFLKASSLASEINGGIYKRQRPAQSSKEDVVINCLPVSNRQLQDAVANVNIHVPNVTVQRDGITDQSHADHPRLNELATLAWQLLDDQFNPLGYTFHVQQQILIQDEDAGDHYVNIRIEFYSVNL